MDEVSPAQAADLVERLRMSAQRLAEFPRSGRMVPAVERDFLRELVVEKYRIIYELREQAVAMATILHSSQDIDARLHELWPDLPAST